MITYSRYKGYCTPVASIYKDTVGENHLFRLLQHSAKYIYFPQKVIGISAILGDFSTLTNNACNSEHPEENAIKHHSHIFPIVGERVEIIFVLHVLSNKFQRIGGSLDGRVHFAIFLVNFRKPCIVVTK